jgi:aspartate aminotransferase
MLLKGILNFKGELLVELSKRIRNMQESPIRKLVPYAENAKAAGRKVYHLNIGQPDIETPVEFYNAVKNYDEKVLKYSFSEGSPQLISSIIEYYKKYEMFYNKEDVLITNGGSEALLFSLIAICDDGDEILVPEPFYTNYNVFALPVGIKMVPITTTPENDFRLPSKEEIEKLITDKTKGFLMSTPGNPTGVVYTKDEVEMICNLAIEKDIFVLSDEVYREFVYDGEEFYSFGRVEHARQHVVIIDSISKRFSACGARIGCVASKNKEFIANVLKLCQSRLCVPTLEQEGAIELYKLDESYYEKVRKEYNKRRDVLFEKLREIDGVICHPPKGAFYTIVTLPVEDAEDFVIWLLRDFHYNNKTVMMAPAEGFYATPGLGKNQVRLAYVINEEDLRNAIDVLKYGLEEYNRIK